MAVGKRNYEEHLGDSRKVPHQHMLSADTQAIIVERKSTQHHSNQLLFAPTTNTDSEQQKSYEETMPGGLPPPSRMTYRTGDSFNVSVTSRSISQSQSRSRSGPRMATNPLKRSPFVPVRRDHAAASSIDDESKLIQMMSCEEGESLEAVAGAINSHGHQLSGEFRRQY